MRRKKANIMISNMFVGLMVGVMVWIAFTTMVGPTTDSAQTARSVSQLDCANGSISDGTKGTCVIADWTPFGWAAAVISGILGAAGGGVYNQIRKSQ